PKIVATKERGTNRRQITKNTKQHYMSKHKMDTIRTFNGKPKMRNKEDIRIRDLLLEEMAEELQEQREFLGMTPKEHRNHTI
ncbi:hypothetical protein TNIN_189751, partial [Trichonephila inaurata madagascariensis]